MASLDFDRLADRYDLAVVDLDGVVYIGKDAVPGAAAGLDAARAAGMTVAFATNNASRAPVTVAGHLRSLGVHADPDDVVTSAQAGAALVADLVPAGSPVFVIGGDGLYAALEERGLRPVTRPDDDPVAVIQGYGPQMPWRQVIDGTILVGSGLPWVATNTDATVPTVRGPGPGNGALVDLVARFTGRQPVVAGKPQVPLFKQTQLRSGGSRPLVIGDRVDTDIDGAHAMGWDSMLVMSGVTTLDDLCVIEPDHRPTFVAADLRGLTSTGTNGAWRVAFEGDTVVVTGSGDAHQWWQAIAAAAWAHLDETGRRASCVGLQPPSVR